MRVTYNVYAALKCEWDDNNNADADDDADVKRHRNRCNVFSSYSVHSHPLQRSIDSQSRAYFQPMAFSTSFQYYLHTMELRLRFKASECEHSRFPWAFGTKQDNQIIKLNNWISVSYLCIVPRWLVKNPKMMQTNPPATKRENKHKLAKFFFGKMEAKTGF